MSCKSKGINGERDLVHQFWGLGLACHRIAGSGSTKYPSPDLIVGNRIRRLAIECKLTKDNKKYFTREEIEALKEFSRIFGAEPWIAVKFKSSDWVFLTLEDLNKTNRSYIADINMAKTRGLLINELISQNY
ncbi:Holliday junction resolvase [Candidatus Woesearchaeota archaeon]|nr:Holliday junction resolvase [Candidatus Woesearchaeota archaeon]|tara:strand:- start:14152 stop:14547 length:396 start_codon:yes stop_codon:yes gene_type:complete